ncbi:low molecular weight phosphatase family protein [Jonesiaceae bacterium BS-20]|uniref:Low molecular weight phosphatase family protein n=1 Tax=Jonesiaceae bacterium BS-20 TaxID=3120821 RepID=A0AAU7DTV2_9MICO
MTNDASSSIQAPSVLFVCSRNGGKSQVAAGYMALEAGAAIEVSSAGTNPADSINTLAAEVLQEQGVDISQQVPRLLTEADMRSASLVVVLGTEARVPQIDGVTIERWETDEPSLRGIEGRERMELVCADIHRHVNALKERLLPQ